MQESLIYDDSNPLYTLKKYYFYTKTFFARVHCAQCFLFWNQCVECVKKVI